MQTIKDLFIAYCIVFTVVDLCGVPDKWSFAIAAGVTLLVWLVSLFPDKTVDDYVG